MAEYFTIPLSPEPQSFSISLSGREYRLTVRWFDVPEGGWTLDITAVNTGETLVAGLPLVTGVNLLEQFEYLGIGGELWLDSPVPATQDNLGAGVDLAFVVR